MSQITTSTFFKVNTFPNQWWAFKQMQLGHSALKNITGLSFYKLLGSGAMSGFSIVPNFGTYVLLCVWETEQAASLFFKENAFFKTYQQKSTENLTVYLRSAEVHGFWDGKQPFQNNAKLDLKHPVLVLTRARIRFRKLWSFWSKVGRVSQSLDGYTGLVLSIGVGEWPVIQQATISLWKTQAEMLDYAYKNSKHLEVVALTKKLNWYSEELFARFVPYKFEGRWQGETFEDIVGFQE